MIPITPRSLVLLALATAGPAAVPTSAPEPAAAVAPSAPAPRDAVRFNFTQTVANIEYAAVRLSHDRPAAVTKSPEVAGDAWYGAIMRRLPGEGPRQSAHYVPFMAVYSGGVATRAWCDVNYNGDLTDDPPVRLSAYPATTGARSFPTDLRWTAAAPSGDLPIDWTIRVVLEPPAADGSGPFFRVQRVHAMMGDVV
ncbi:MAG TPA: hypothetical protein VFT43_00235, partial [Candidatus Polarisedimenticolia bacterium]|nr:hypothetical protein [Candidatus Polarisedimenticolia bacterium]